MFDVVCKGEHVHVPNAEWLEWLTAGFTVLCGTLPEGETVTLEVTRRLPDEVIA